MDLAPLLNAEVRLGLVQQGHIRTIERMLGDGCLWNEIGEEINWEPETARQHYEWFLRRSTAAKNHVLMFKEQFADDVWAGLKNRTMRPERKRPILPGDTLDLRKWSGRPYASKQIHLRKAVCLKRSWVEVYTVNFITVNFIRLKPGELDPFANADGFPSIEKMIRFFDHEHGLPFYGDLIEWSLYLNPAEGAK